MNKKILVSVFLCLFLSSFTMLAEEKLQVIEHVFWDEEVLFNYTYLETPDYREYESDTLFAFQVPPSPKSKAIFFDFGCQSHIFWYGGYTPRLYDSRLKINIISDVIPDNIIFYNTCGMESVTHELLPMDGRPNKTTYKMAMRRDDFLLASYPSWNVEYVSGENVPNEIANNILNDLIDNGFDVEVLVIGKTEGVEEYVIISAWMHVTRALKK